MIFNTLQINVTWTPEVMDKFILYYPNMEAVADEIVRQIKESRTILSGKPLALKYRKYKGEEDRIR